MFEKLKKKFFKDPTPISPVFFCRYVENAIARNTVSTLVNSDGSFSWDRDLSWRFKKPHIPPDMFLFSAVDSSVEVWRV